MEDKVFTGIVQHIGKVVARRSMDLGIEVVIETAFAPLQPGESISVDGVCLTATEASADLLYVEISPETLAKTTLSTLDVGSSVNLERALKMGDAIGGHWVTGHIDTVALVKEIEEQGAFTNVTFTGISPSMARWLIPKGSIAVNGVSLTVNKVSSDGFSVTLIPHTFEKTNLKQVVKLFRVNVEFDWMVKTVLRDLGTRMDLLQEAHAEVRPN